MLGQIVHHRPPDGDAGEDLAELPVLVGEAGENLIDFLEGHRRRMQALAGRRNRRRPGPGHRAQQCQMLVHALDRAFVRLDLRQGRLGARQPRVHRRLGHRQVRHGIFVRGGECLRDDRVDAGLVGDRRADGLIGGLQVAGGQYRDDCVEEHPDDRDCGQDEDQRFERRQAQLEVHLGQAQTGRREGRQGEGQLKRQGKGLSEDGDGLALGRRRYRGTVGGRLIGLVRPRLRRVTRIPRRGTAWLARGRVAISRLRRAITRLRLLAVVRLRRLAVIRLRLLAIVRLLLAVIRLLLLAVVRLRRLAVAGWGSLAVIGLGRLRITGGRCVALVRVGVLGLIGCLGRVRSLGRRVARGGVGGPRRRQLIAAIGAGLGPRRVPGRTAVRTRRALVRLHRATSSTPPRGKFLRRGEPSPNPPNRTRILGAGRPIRVLAPARAHLQIDRYARSRARRRLRLGAPRIPICLVPSADPG